MWPKLGKIIMYMGGILAILTAALALYAFIEQRATERVLFTEITSIDELTAFKGVPNLTGNFEYKGSGVECLWRVELKITNTGKDTLITSGADKNLFTDNIAYLFSEGERVLDVKINRNDPKTRPPKVSESGFEFRFDQWKPNEVLNLSVFVATGYDHKGYPTPSYFNDRAIVDGEMIMSNESKGADSGSGKRPLIDYCPGLLQVILRIFIGIAAGTVFLIAIIFSLTTAAPDILRSIKMNRWHKEYGTRYYKLLEEEAEKKSIPDSQIDAWKKNPAKAWDRVWERFNGPKPPKGPELSNSVKRAFLITLISLSISAIYLLPFLAIIEM